MRYTKNIKNGKRARRILMMALSVPRGRAKESHLHTEIFIYWENVAIHYCGLLRLDPPLRSPHHFHVTMFFR